ncbi:hypothetical protein [Phormidium sp. CCY1219]|nr:hypothetical protein [Phormidium sp. CCY1219]MEB3829229.1 hypothetical protein [Phormidium sp. CCY1219]
MEKATVEVQVLKPLRILEVSARGGTARSPRSPLGAQEMSVSSSNLLE